MSIIPKWNMFGAGLFPLRFPGTNNQFDEINELPSSDYSCWCHNNNILIEDIFRKSYHFMKTSSVVLQIPSLSIIYLASVWFQHLDLSLYLNNIFYLLSELNFDCLSVRRRRLLITCLMKFIQIKDLT